MLELNNLVYPEGSRQPLYDIDTGRFGDTRFWMQS